MKHSHFIVPPGTKIRLKDYDPGFTGSYKTKEEASVKLRKDIKRLAKYQDVLYAQNTYALLVILQAMDTAGKDGTIRHVMSGVNPQGTQVYSFKAPSAEELDHDFSLAEHESFARARPDRHFQSLVLRRGAGRPRPQRDSGFATTATRSEGKGHLEASLRRNQFF